MEIYKSKQTNREPDISDYKEYKLKENNKGNIVEINTKKNKLFIFFLYSAKGFQMLQKLGWTEGQGLGVDGGGILNPVNKFVFLS